MDAYTADEDVSLSIPLIIDGEYVTPDVGSVYYTVRSNTGTVLVNSTAVTTTTDTTTVVITIDAAHNSITKTFENRFVTLTFTVNSAPRRLSKTYQLTTWVPLTCVQSDVRSLLGVTEFEVPDQDIDLLGAYLSALDDVGSSLTTALTAGDLSTIKANKLVAVTAAFQILPSLRLRIMASEKSDINQATRAAKIDFDGLMVELAFTYSELKTALTGVDEVTPQLMLFATPTTDPITGA